MISKTIKILIWPLLVLLHLGSVYGQTTFPTNGAANAIHTTYAFTNCVLHIDEEVTISNATLVVKDGKIVDAALKVAIPIGAVVVDLKGKHIYPSFIDIYSDLLSSPEIKKNRGEGGEPQSETNIKGAYGWNQAIRPENDVYKNYINNESKAAELRKMGFGAVVVSSKDGIMRGTGALVSLSAKRENANVIKDRVADFYSFSKGSSTQDYPSSLMGSIALLRQTFFDAQWYLNDKNKTEYNISLSAMANNALLPHIFEANDKLNILRADKIGDEFKMNFIIKGKGDEYQRINEIKATNAKLIISVNFPEAFDVTDIYDSENISMADLKHWEMAPYNLNLVAKYFIPFALTTADLKDKADFIKNLTRSIKCGLSPKTALKALTKWPAEFLGVQDQLGSLKKGMNANFFISSKEIFEEGAFIYENWIAGEPFRMYDLATPELAGKYELKLNHKLYKCDLAFEKGAISGKISLKDTAKTKLNISLTESLITIGFSNDTNGYVRLTGSYNESTKSFSGMGVDKKGDSFAWNMLRVAEASLDKKSEDQNKAEKVSEITYPFTAFGKPEKDENILQRFKNRLGAVLIKDATIWTNEAEGNLLEYDVYIVDGKIVRIAENIDAPKDAFAKVINAKGKHLTPGIIDEHSHIAISDGVNEGTQASSAEVRIGDVVDCDDINIYRQLAGGVVASQLLHGSANPIGGQSALIKLRWGLAPEEMKIEKADGFIKFALGENVKQSNWGDRNTTRFPQTRMGVEQMYFDHFIRAKEYDAKWNTFNANSAKDKIAPRRDLELEALSEIVNKKRFITCHSYVQSEINMLMKVADSMGFKVNTFTHILEGYKVADKMKAHGVNASTFSDWWAYKMEVAEAIPFNAALLTKMGVNTAINSDDAEMGRRLNQEAAKAIKYGGLSEQEALKLVTLNAAKMLHLDDKMGSIKPGKSGDVVIWSDNPLSVNAKVEYTIIDGIIYFDSKDDLKMREEMKVERARIMEKMLQAKNKGESAKKPEMKRPKLYHCDTMESEFTNEEINK